MDIDDSSEKIRRNLLVFSFIIVVSSFLDISIQKESKVFNAFDLASVSPFKFWLVITFILIYLFYRYWFDTNSHAAIDHFKNEQNNVNYREIKKLLNKDIENSFLKNKQPKYLKGLAELENPHYVENTKTHGKPVKVESTGNLTYNGVAWIGRIGNEYSITWDGANYAHAGGNDNKYEIPFLRKKYIQLITMINIIIYSKSIGELIIPLTLFAVALSISVYKVIISCTHFYPLNFC